MSEYLSKKAVLEWLDEKIISVRGLAIGFRNQGDELGERDCRHDADALSIIKSKILSGAFDADNTEIQRLRAALVEIKQLLNENRENDGAFQSWNHMQAWKVATQALSTTTEPINAEKVERVRGGDGNDA